MKLVNKLLLGLCLCFIVYSCQQDEEITLTTQEQLEQLVLEIKEETGISIFYEPGTSELQLSAENQISVTSADYPSTDYSKLLSEVKHIDLEIKKIPEGFIDTLNIDCILLVNHNLGWAGKASNFPLAVVGLNNSSTSSFFNQRLIPHEFFHLFDFGGGSLIDPNSTFELSWAENNPPDFEYGDGCGSGGLNFAPSDGFLNNYARCDPSEDRAVLFSFMYDRHSAAKALIEQDPYLKGKSEIIKDMLSAFNFQF